MNEEKLNEIVELANDPIFCYYSMACMILTIIIFLSAYILEQKLKEENIAGKIKVVAVWLWLFVPGLIGILGMPLDVRLGLGVIIELPWFLLQFPFFADYLKI